MVKKLFCLAFAAMLLAAAPAGAQSNNVQRYVDASLKTDTLLQNAAVSLLAVDSRGRTLAQWNPDQPLVTASTMKTITAGVALDALGPDFRFETRLATAGSTDEDGVLHGDLYIIGGGDPTLGSKSEIAEDINLVFAKWADALRGVGITAIDGRVIADDDFFGDETVHDNWCWIDYGADYGSSPSGLSYCENLSFYRVEPGLAEGNPLAITPVESVYSRMDLRQDAVTGPERSGNKLNYYASDLSPVGRFTGTYALDRRVDTIAVSNRFAALTCAEAFASYLASGGVSSSGAAAGSAPDSAQTVLISYSPSLRTICGEMLKKSNNFFAEALFLTLGRQLTGQSNYSKTASAVEEYIAAAGCRTTGLRQDDGSGLSRQNFVSPRFFCNFYRIMQKSNIFAPYLEAFPTPGGEGTLKYVLAKEPQQLRGRIHCKSGSMTGVRCYAGYVETSGGEMLSFAIMVNNYDCPTRAIQPKIEGFLKQLALYERQ